MSPPTPALSRSLSLLPCLLIVASCLFFLFHCSPILKTLGQPSLSFVDINEFLSLKVPPRKDSIHPLQSEGASQPISWNMATMSRDSTVTVTVTVTVTGVRTRPRAIPLAMITMRKSIHGCFTYFNYLCEHGAPLGCPSGRQSSAISRLHADPQAFTPASLRSTLVSLGNAKVCQLTVSP